MKPRGRQRKGRTSTGRSARLRPAAAGTLALTPTPEDLEQMVEGLIREIYWFSQQAGMNERTIRQIIRRSATPPAPGAPSRAEQGQFSVFRQISEILNSWHTDPAFIDDAGQPSALRIAGEHSFSTLAKRHCPTLDPQALAQRLAEEQVLVRAETGLLKPRRRTVSFGSFNSLMLDRVPALQRAMLATIAHNLNPITRALGTHCERGAMIEDLPVALVPAFTQVAKDLAQRMIDDIDNWGNNQKAQHQDPNTPRTCAGVTIFSFADPPSSTREPP